ncbi:hypothetical protein SETIT_2G277300v2 [Setaria italica]|uniref:Uncharacterized protein n=1 Tax=Setaria italica TaxID=4555 RepID=A0A368Q3P5_SETIT|nr:hypothetical protein SETIT_2G277300v2 [Setaria italica]
MITRRYKSVGHDSTMPKPNCPSIHPLGLQTVFLLRPARTPRHPPPRNVTFTIIAESPSAPAHLSKKMIKNPSYFFASMKDVYIRFCTMNVINKQKEADHQEQHSIYLPLLHNMLWGCLIPGLNFSPCHIECLDTN